MSVTMDQGADALLQAAHAAASLEDELSVADEDGSSSLSEIEDKDADQDDDGEGSDELSNMSEEENDSEAETERIEVSPHKFRAQKDVVLSSRNDDHGYERTPSKLQKHFTADDDDDDDDEPLSDADVSMDESPESPKSSAHEDAEPEHTTGSTSLEDSSAENKTSYSAVESDTRKRKRSIMAGSGLEEEIGEPVRKRTGSIMTPGDDYAIEEDIPQEEDPDVLNPTSGNISGDDGGVTHEEEVVEEAEDQIAVDEEAVETVDIPISPKKRGRKKKKGTENGVSNHVEDMENLPDPETTTNGEDARHADEDNADNEGDDEAEAAQRNEEELEKKRIALDQLTSIERQFSTFRDRLHEERLEQLNREDAMLRQDPPTHPEYLAMMRCVDARRDERIRIANTLRDYQIESLKRSAVSKRSQILSQYQQEVRETREKKMELLGKQWYEIQHDRRSYIGVPDYTLKFPTRRSQQVMNQVAYSNEVSLLSGIAKYVGFPAAPLMAPATMSELEEDLEKMGRTRQPQQIHQGGIPLQELAALRTAGSTSRFKPAEEQFIEQTPWANPQHPSHAHLLQRQASAQQVPRTTSPFSSHPQGAPRRHSHQQGAGVPISGTFSNSNSSLLQHSKSLAMSGGRISPHNPFNSNHSHTIVPSPLGSRQASPQLPHLNRPPQPVPSKAQQDGPKSNGIQHSPTNGLTEIPRDFPPEVRREQAAAIMGRF